MPHGDGVGDFRADRAVLSADGDVDDDRLAAGDGVTRQLDHGVIEGGALRAQGEVVPSLRFWRRLDEERRDVEHAGAAGKLLRREEICATDELVQRAGAESGQLFADRSGEMVEIRSEE